jgi:hypothetical protein
VLKHTRLPSSASALPRPELAGVPDGHLHLVMFQAPLALAGVQCATWYQSALAHFLQGVSLLALCPALIVCTRLLIS